MWKSRWDSSSNSSWSRTPSPDFALGRYSPTYPNSNGKRGRENQDLNIGDRVIIRSSVGDARTGVLRFVGNVDFAEGQEIWAGVELFYPQGRNDGTIRGIEYFRCKHPYGVFVPLNKVDNSPANWMKVKGSGSEDHGAHCDDRCQVHDKVYWNTEARLGNKVTGVRNVAL